MLANMTSVHLIRMFANIRDIMITSPWLSSGQLAQIVSRRSSPDQLPQQQRATSNSTTTSNWGSRRVSRAQVCFFLNSSIFY